MNTFRYVVGVVLMISMPPGLIFWFVVHPFVSRWRRLGVRWTYIVLGSATVAAMVFLVFVRDWLLGPDLGTSYVTILFAVPCMIGAFAIGIRRKKYLTFRILAGVPEVSEAGDQELLRAGPYAVIRHPRYIEALLAVLGYALVANYVGGYILWVLCLPTIYLIVLLEERELRARFGMEHLEYCQQVPRFVPRRWATLWGKAAA